jgi:hypothetical protein
MQVQAFLADHASISGDDTVNAMGIGLNKIRAPVFPMRHTRLVLVVRLLISPSECGHAHRLHIDILDPDGADLLRTEHGSPSRVTRSSRTAHRRCRSYGT